MGRLAAQNFSITEHNKNRENEMDNPNKEKTFGFEFSYSIRVSASNEEEAREKMLEEIFEVDTSSMLDHHNWDLLGEE